MTKLGPILFNQIDFDIFFAELAFKYNRYLSRVAKPRGYIRTKLDVLVYLHNIILNYEDKNDLLIYIKTKEGSQYIGTYIYNIEGKLDKKIHKL